jgi:hypothetical protein
MRRRNPLPTQLTCPTECFRIFFFDKLGFYLFIYVYSAKVPTKDQVQKIRQQTKHTYAYGSATVECHATIKNMRPKTCP